MTGSETDSSYKAVGMYDIMRQLQQGRTKSSANRRNQFVSIVHVRQEPMYYDVTMETLDFAKNISVSTRYV
ncbi:hypothetical protein GGF31_003436 [Allomyces arbusculus]|nr:hypothetical protein GGF31_003436 [Allomyces arbusculus]